MPIFKRYGREVVLQVKDVMSSPPVVVRLGADIREAVEVMWSKRIGSVMVVDDDGRLAGLLTERDILYAATQGMLCRESRVEELMTVNVVTAKPEDDVSNAIERMRQTNVRHLPVVDDDGKPVGMLSVRDIMDAAALFMRIISRLE